MKITASDIMTTGFHTLTPQTPVNDAVKVFKQANVFSDVHRLFVHQSKPDELVGVISLSDAARIRSGSCHACISSRIKLDT